MTKQLKLAVFVTGFALLAQPTGAADVVTISAYGEDGDETYYQVTCSDSTKGSVVVHSEPRKVCAHPANGKSVCRSSWTVRLAASQACK